jgi:hypothetical protein
MPNRSRYLKIVLTNITYYTQDSILQINFVNQHFFSITDNKCFEPRRYDYSKKERIYSDNLELLYEEEDIEYYRVLKPIMVIEYLNDVESGHRLKDTNDPVFYTDITECISDYNSWENLGKLFNDVKDSFDLNYIDNYGSETLVFSVIFEGISTYCSYAGDGDYYIHYKSILNVKDILDKESERLDKEESKFNHYQWMQL